MYCFQDYLIPCNFYIGTVSNKYIDATKVPKIHIHALIVSVLRSHVQIIGTPTMSKYLLLTVLDKRLPS